MIRIYLVVTSMDEAGHIGVARNLKTFEEKSRKTASKQKLAAIVPENGFISLHGPGKRRGPFPLPDYSYMENRAGNTKRHFLTFMQIASNFQSF